MELIGTGFHCHGSSTVKNRRGYIGVLLTFFLSYQELDRCRLVLENRAVIQTSLQQGEASKEKQGSYLPAMMFAHRVDQALIRSFARW